MFLSINGVRLFVDVLNSGLAIGADGALHEKPVLVCLHGGPGGDHQTLRPWFDQFADIAQVIYFDQRGGGRSDHGSPESWTLDQWADDLAALCSALGLVKPIVLGISGGAMVTQAWLGRHSGQAGGAILINACARLDREVMIAGFGRLGGPDAEAAARGMYTRAAMEDLGPFARHCLPFYSRGGKFGFPAGPSRSRFNFAVGEHFFGPGGEAFRYDHRAVLGDVAAPVLAISGAHDPVTRPEWGREIVDALPPGVGEYALFEGSSHVISADEPDRLARAVEAFVRTRAEEAGKAG